MARLARSILVGYPHQVTQRGNYDQNIFQEDADYRRYLEWLCESSTRYSTAIWAYCLMPNHVHYVCVPSAADGLSRTFNTLHMKYAQHVHRKKGVTGHLWRGRFLSCILDNPSVFEEVRFIENNPIRMGLVERPEDYPWSSARSHILGTPDPALAEGCFLKGEVLDWRAYLASAQNEGVVRRTWERLKTGRPAGDEGFVRGLEKLTGRRLAALPRGRPRKNTVAVIK